MMREEIIMTTILMEIIEVLMMRIINKMEEEIGLDTTIITNFEEKIDLFHFKIATATA